MKTFCRLVSSLQCIKPSMITIYMVIVMAAILMMNDIIVILTLIPDVPMQCYYSIVIEFSSITLSSIIVILYKKFRVFPMAVGIIMTFIVHFTHIESIILTAGTPITCDKFIFIFSLCQFSIIFILNDTFKSAIGSVALQTVLSVYGVLYLRYRIFDNDDATQYIIKKLGVVYLIMLFICYYITKLKYKLLKTELVSEKYLIYWKAAMDDDAQPLLILNNTAPVFSNAAFQLLFGISEFPKNLDYSLLEKNTITKDSKVYHIKKKSITYQGQQALLLRFIDATTVKDKEYSDTQSDQLLFATVIHELRTPLNIIMSILNSVAEHIESFNIKKEISKASCAASLQECLINDVLDMTKVNHGNLQLNLQPANLYLCLQSVYELFKYQVSNGINFCIYLELSSTSLFLIDERRYRQIILNLLSNSAKFTKTGLIKLQSSYCNGVLTTSVIDTGVGIPTSEQDKIFTRFGMVQSSCAINKSGTGLGLNLCKNLVEKMGGKINFESIPNVRTKFSFTINCAEVENDKTNSQLCFAGINAILIDDNELNLSILVSYSKKLGINSFSFRDPKEALLHVENAGDSIQIAFIDLHMPEMDGFQCCVEMGRLRNHIKMIAISADDKDAVYLNCLKNGFVDVMEKPLSFLGFEKMVQKHLSVG